MMPYGSRSCFAVAAMRRSISTPRMPSSVTRLLSGSAIAKSESKSLRCSTGAILSRFSAPPLNTTSCTRLGRVPEAEVVVDGRQVVGRLPIHRHENVADLETAGRRRAAGPDIRDDDPVVPRTECRRHVEVMVCMLMPISCRRSWPNCFNCRNAVRAVALGIANPRPSFPPDCERTNVLTPTTSPRMLTSGPPEFPGLIGASVWT